jgi:dienelactone hydrolase
MLSYGDDGLERTVSIVIQDGPTLQGTLGLPQDAGGVVLFAHGSGSSRFSARNRYVARVLRDAGLATLLLDLLSPHEDELDQITRAYRFDIMMLAERLVHTIDWLEREADTKGLPIGLFGASTGGGAGLVAAAKRPAAVRTVVSRGGRPDLAGDALPLVRCPVLLIVGGDDEQVIEMNRAALQRMQTDVKIEIVPGATHLFEEPGTLERVSELARDWLLEFLPARSTTNA